MASFVIDETHLQRLTAGARRELLDLLAADVANVRGSFSHLDWDPDANVSYPLDEEEALALVRGVHDSARRLLRQLARSFDGNVGEASMEDLLAAGRYGNYDELSSDISHITLRLRGITQNNDAWLLNWRARDWTWDEETQSYTSGSYFISSPAILAMREAFGIREKTV